MYIRNPKSFILFFKILISWSSVGFSGRIQLKSESRNTFHIVVCTKYVF